MATRDEIYWSAVYDSQNYQIEQLEQERDQLKARILELEDFVRRYNHWVFVLKDGRVTELDQREYAEILLGRQPPQSLEAHDREVAARALDDVADHHEWIDGLSWKDVQFRLRAIAAQIRAGGEKG